MSLDGSINSTFNPGYSTDISFANTFNSGGPFVEDSSGNFYVGGNFISYNGTSAIRLIKLFPSGSIDTSFNVGPTGFNSEVKCIAIDSAGKLYVGGTFTSYQGVTANRIIKLNTDGSKDATFDNSTGFSTNSVFTITLDSAGKLYVGGSFTNYKGVAANRIIKLNTDGSKDATFDNSTGFDTGEVHLIKLDSSGKLVVIGTFTAYKSTTTNRIARILTTGALDTTFLNGVGTGFTVGSPYNFVFDSAGKLYVVGNFTTYNGVLAQNRIIKLNTDGTKDTSFNFGTGFNGTTSGIVIDSSGKIYVGGGFSTYNGITQPYIFSLNSDGTQNSSFDAQGTGLFKGFNSTVNALKLSSTDKIYALGLFTTYQAYDMGIIALNTTGSKSTAFNNYKGVSNSAISAGSIICSVKDSAGNIYAGGTFTTYNLTTANYIIKLFPDGSIDTSFNTGTGFNSSVFALAIDPSTGKIYAGGFFTTFNGNTAQYIIRLNTNGQRDPTFDTTTGFNSNVNTIALDSSGNLYVGGGFTTYKSTNATYIVKLFSNASIDTSFAIAGTTFNASIQTIVLDSAGKLYVGGTFTLYRGAANLRIIKLNTDNSKDTSFDNTTGFNTNVTQIVLDSAGKLYVAGLFTLYKSVSANSIIKLNTDGSKDTSFNFGTGFNSQTQGLFIDASGSIYVGGLFITYNGSFAGGIIKLLPTGAIDTSFNVTSAGFNTSVRSIIKLT